jgi:hypothetical protein
MTGSTTDCGPATPAPLGLAMTAGQLRTRRWLTLWALCWGLPLFLAGLVAGFLPPTGLPWMLFVFVSIAAVLMLLVNQLGGGVWERLDSQQMVQLLEVAKAHPAAAAMVSDINAMGRDFVLQDWLQARAIELAAGQRSQALEAAAAEKCLRQMRATPP